MQEISGEGTGTTDKLPSTAFRVGALKINTGATTSQPYSCNTLYLNDPYPTAPIKIDKVPKS